MDNRLNLLHPYPFAKMATLLADSKPSADYELINLGIGEPKHQPPSFVIDTLRENLPKVQNYPSTGGLDTLNQAIADWLQRRFGLSHIDAGSQVTPVMGTREAIFSFVQAVIDSSNDDLADKDKTQAAQKPIVVMPNPFYQIYEGAALLAGAEPYYVPCTKDNDFKGDYLSVPDEIWQRTQLVFVCSPNNPTGAVMDRSDWQALIELSDKYGFVLASDECYSELYFDTPPLGLLEVCADMERHDCQDNPRHDFKNCVVFHSLSKRSNLPGLRSGFIAGDAALLTPYLKYRTYQGCAMPIHHQLASISAWQDEAHVEHNRALYQEKFDLWMSQLGDRLNLRRPDAGFYLWMQVPSSFVDDKGDADDESFVKALYEQVSIKALAGRYLSREVNGYNPGKGFVRLAMVASVEESQEAISRIHTLLNGY